MNWCHGYGRFKQGNDEYVHSLDHSHSSSGQYPPPPGTSLHSDLEVSPSEELNKYRPRPKTTTLIPHHFSLEPATTANMSTLLETRAEAAARSETIFRKHVLLRRVLERHEATIGKRWQKKSRLQRLGILLAAWPDMPRTHRPDFAAFRSDHENIARAAVQHRSAFLWPSVNQEDLADPRTLPILLNSRARNPHMYSPRQTMTAAIWGESRTP